MKLTDVQRDALRPLSTGTPIQFFLRGGRDAWRDTLVDLSKVGLVKAHRSSIGEIDEKVTFTITDAGLAALKEKP